MKPKTLRQVVLTGYALYYDRKTHLSVKKLSNSTPTHLQMCTSSTAHIFYCHKCVYHDNLSIAFYDGHVIDNSFTTSLGTSDSVTYLKCSNTLRSINTFRV